MIFRRKNANVVNPTANGAGPIKSQNTGCSECTATIVARSKSVKVMLESLRSLPVLPDRTWEFAFFVALLNPLDGHETSCDKPPRLVLPYRSFETKALLVIDGVRV
jgi:hypothetical protein